MEYHCDSIVSTVEQIYRYYNDKSIVKIRMQRKIRWVDFDKSSKKANNYDFIQFMLKTKNTVNPLLLLERIVNNKKCMFVIDGNNRLNAIISFLNRPFYYLEHLIPNELPNDIISKIKETSFMKMTNEYTTLKKFCQCNGFKEYFLNNINTMMNDNDDSIDSKYEFMIGELRVLHVLDIKVPVTKFENMDIDDIKEIYEGVNKGGVRLTKQEILASTTSLHYYHPFEINKFVDIQNEVRSYYCDMNDKEFLKFESDTYDALNLFEILIAVQTMLNKQHNFISQVGSMDLDVIFKCYEIVSGCKFEDYNPKLNEFIENFESACKFITELQNITFNNLISYKNMDRKLSLKCNNLCVYICWLIKNNNKLHTQEFKKKGLSILVYHELCTLIKNKDTKPQFAVFDILAYQGGGQYNRSLSQSIFRKDIEEKYFPTKERLKQILDVLRNENIVACEYSSKRTRSKANKFTMLVLSLYYNDTVPINLLDINKSLDHIIPYSAQWDGVLDINRLGNLVLIDDTTNKKKGKTIIDERFIHENKLYYYNYPQDVEIKLILTHDRTFIQSNVKYNEVCNRRELLYFDTIINTISNA